MVHLTGRLDLQHGITAVVATGILPAPVHLRLVAVELTAASLGLLALALAAVAAGDVRLSTASPAAAATLSVV